MKHISIAACALLLMISACKKDDDDNGPVPVTIARETYPLPGDSLFPEGIAYHPLTGHFYTGSVTNGNILKVDVQSGIASLWASGAAQGRAAATGMKLDAFDRLWVCGGADASVSVLDPNGNLLKRWDMATTNGAGFVNDCIIDETHIYFTDSRVQKIYRTSVTDTGFGLMETWLSFTDAEIPFAPTGINANGIEQTADGRLLLVVVSSSGKLYRIHKGNKSISEITLNTPITSGDGLLLEGNRLYVSRNALNLIYPVEMSLGFGQGMVGTGFGTGLLFNTTIARAGNYLLAVNGQLNRRATNDPVLPFSVSRVSVP